MLVLARARAARVATVVVLVALACATSNAQDASARNDHFESKIRPLLIEHCERCHGAAAGKQKGGLRLDHRDGWAIGGDSGPAIVPGDVDASLLIRAVRYGDDALQMPPDSRLPAAAIAALERWVRDGAHDPRERPTAGEASTPTTAADRASDVAHAHEHWAFQPMRDVPALPAVDGVDPIDATLRAARAAAGVEPANVVSRATWLRRATYVLTGLPATADEVDAFVADPAPDRSARERVVDRLLASPHYGERQARRWLDLVRYSDSNGLDENLAMSHAWRYRDYVVRAFADDLPFDRFVQEQIAGDQLDDGRDGSREVERWIATGMLVLGPKMLAEQDKEKLAMDVVDEQLDVVGRAVLGLTIGCARCHDHKFDPLPTADYYALAGIFRSTSSIEEFSFVSKWREREVGTTAELARAKAHREAVERAQRALDARVTADRDAVRSAGRARLAQTLVDATELAAESLFVEAETASRGNLGADATTYGDAKTTIAHTKTGGRQFAEYDLTFAGGGRHRLWIRYAAKDPRPMRVAWNGTRLRDDVGTVATGDWSAASQRWFDLGEVHALPGRNVLAIEADAVIVHVDKWLLVPRHRAEAGADAFVRTVAQRIVATVRSNAGEGGGDGGDPVVRAWLRYVAPSDHPFANRSDVGSKPVDGPFRALFESEPPTSLAEAAARFALVVRTLDAAAAAPAKSSFVAAFDPIDADLDAMLPEADRAEQSTLRAALVKLHAIAPPPLPQAMVVVDAERIVDLPIHVRGNHRQLAATPTPRGTLQAVAPLVPSPTFRSDASGRRELAIWLTDPRHPLTARVAVNRLWQAAFGEGLVRSPSNFGLRGDTPTLRDLLDRLALDFVADGWSTKRMLRRLVLSETFALGAEPSPTSRALDPDNRRFAFVPRRRLDAEAIRDAWLVVGGNLDATVGGTLLKTRNRDYVTNDQSADRADYDSTRRSLYLPLIRNATYDLFTVFDFHDPAVPVDARPTTTIASQALLLMNAPLIRAQAARLRDRARAAAATQDDAGFVDAAFRLAWTRRPDDVERDLALTFLRGGDGATRDVDFCQTLLAASEFLFVD